MSHSDRYLRFLAETKPCERCSKRFKPRDRATPQRFCNPICRQEAYQDKLRRPRPALQKCEICQENFPPRRSGGNRPRWCSAACRREAKINSIVTKKCSQCGGEFETFRGNQKYCGIECLDIMRKWKRLQKYRESLESMTKQRAQAKAWNDAERQRVRSVRRVNCRACNAEIVGRHTAVYCGLSCYWARRKSMTAEQIATADAVAPREHLPARVLSTGPMLVECLWCGDDFEGLADDVYCSEDCQADDAVERMKEAS